jgi:4-oxalmesaconate hydratase
MIIDCHGHFTTAPVQLEAWRKRQVAAVGDPVNAPDPADLVITDDELREAIEGNQLRLMNERGSDLTIFSPRATFMAHHIGDFAVSSVWARICNDLVYRVSTLVPDRFAMGAMLPQSPGADPATCLPELRRAVEELGAVTINLNPDPSGGQWSAPPLTDRSWYPIYEALAEHDIPAMIHVSTSCNPAVVHTTGAHYLHADTTAFMQLIQADLFTDFPTLRFVIPHGGGAVPYHWGRFRGIAMVLGRPEPERLLANVSFDTCVYHQPGIDLLTGVIPTESILFASEMIGAVRDIDPLTGHYFDDTLRYVNATTNLTAEQREAVLSGNALRVYPRLAAQLAARTNDN